MLYLLGTGINDEYDLTLREIDILKKCDEILFENYTSLNRININHLEEMINKKVKPCKRQDIENDEEAILERARKQNIAIMVIGDPLIATTHTMFLVDGYSKGIEVKVINNVSVLNAIAKTGLEVYKFGRIVSIPWQKNANSFFEYLTINLKNDMHTLCLLDIDAENNRFMNFKEALSRIAALDNGSINEAVVCCALGTEDETIMYDSIDNLMKKECNKYPQCLIIPAKMHFMEQDSLMRFKNGN